ncbi:MAG: hypothetical protein JO126_08455 [Alphaproteobacteria bacterium]|nr:hypothetical protein [Alphaproteobacteria bacterium]MBV8549472.1 hypothetical protein [Alphaproteobacteria bacterium]
MKLDLTAIKHNTVNCIDQFRTWLCAPPYEGVPWMCWLYVLFCGLYAGGAPFHGQLAWFDDNVRMVQILEWINGVHGWYDHVLMRVNAPEGFHTIWSRVVDAPIAAVIIAFQGLVGQRQAIVVAVTLIPMLQTLMLFFAAPYFAAPLIGRDKAQLVNLFVLFTQCLNPDYFTLSGFEMGAVSHHTWYILLGLTLLGSAIRLLTEPGRKTTAIFVASNVTLLLVGIEAFPLLALAAFLLAVITWQRQDAMLARASAVAFGLVAIITAIDQPINHPPAEWLNVSFSEPSIFGAIITACAAVFFLLTEQIVKRKPGSRQCFVMMTLLAAAMGGALIALFPELLNGAAAGLTPEERMLAHREHTEAVGLYAVAINTVDYVRLIMPSVIAFIWMRHLVRNRKGAEERPIYIYFYGLVIITFIYASIFSRLVFYMALSDSVVLMHLWLHTAAKMKDDQNASLKKFLLYVFLGPLWMLIVPAANYNSGFGDKVLMFPAKKQFGKQTCDMTGIAEYLHFHYSNDKTIMVQMYTSDKFLYWTDLKVYFLANFPSQNKFINARRFYMTKDADIAHTIATEGHVDLVAVCQDDVKLGADTAFANSLLHNKTFEQQLTTGEIPSWLKPVRMQMASPYLLFEVVK